MTNDEERWIEAVTVERMFGDRAPVWVASRIGELALADDQAGIQRWLEIASRLDELLRNDRSVS